VKVHLLACFLAATSLARIEPARAEEPSALPEIVVNSVGMKFAGVTANEFSMGSPTNEGGRAEDETQHQVHLSRAFYMGVHEVTQGQYFQVTGLRPSIYSPEGSQRDRVVGEDTDELPVDSISWHDATEFCRRLSQMPAEQQAGRRYRLPTEAEWECAARGGSLGVWAFGDDVDRLVDYAWLRSNSNARPHRVGCKQANPFGLYDMYGNVWEWCSDWYADDYFAQGPQRDPAGPETGTRKVIRGGGWDSLPFRARSAARGFDPPSIGDSDTGFRVVLESGGHTTP
jgi:formylglycine-generating enzyme required for sulfatase activity